MRAEQWVFLAKAVATLLIIKVSLKLFTFDKFKRLFSRMTKTGSHLTRSDLYVEDTAWAVRTAAHVLPVSLTCLPQALAVKYLLRNYANLPLNIGVQQSAINGFEAHAWVERAGQIIIGEWPEGKTYRALWVWE
ncbi:lasso peptide biosynthesis B2 protein [Persicitalea jodogahamensis]|uniref:lasso peptide biosynthesis B2 protein n=1 Tax=Persicitalea jodogahamensis TaxID=402147 RepID=UPI0021D0ACFB|nr:lasso peptide biosynthesis B2 protein [Persicitalea jodogahamensis]